MKVNKALIWDYDWKESDYDTEDFRRWYIARVLSRGSMEDIRNAGGVAEVRRLFSSVCLPLELERLWSWYLGIPGPRSELYGRFDTLPARFP